MQRMVVGVLWIVLSLTTSGARADVVSATQANSIFRSFQAAGVAAPLFNLSTTNSCAGGSITAAPSAASIDRERTVLNSNLEWFNQALSSAATSRNRASELAAQLTVLAQSDAFVELNWDGSGSSPAHWQLVLLRNIAMAVNLIDFQQGWGEGQRAVVVGWGNRVYDNTHYCRWGRSGSDRWPDTYAAAASAYIYWGVATLNREAFMEGVRDFGEVVKLIEPDGSWLVFFRGQYAGVIDPTWDMSLNDKAIGDLVMAAYVAARVGVDLFGYAPDGASIYDTVVWWQDVIPTGATYGQDMSFLRPHGAERGWSWTEYFVASFPDDAATTSLRERSAAIRSQNANGFVGIATGPASCLIR